MRLLAADMGWVDLARIAVEALVAGGGAGLGARSLGKVLWSGEVIRRPDHEQRMADQKAMFDFQNGIKDALIAELKDENAWLKKNAEQSQQAAHEHASRAEAAERIADKAIGGQQNFAELLATLRDALGGKRGDGA